MSNKDTKGATWPKPWRLRWWPRDASERGLPSFIDSYHDTKEEAEQNAPLAPWQVECAANAIDATEDAEWVQPEYFTVCTDESYREQQDAVSFALATAYRDRFDAEGEPNWLVMADVAMRALNFRKRGEPL